MSVYKDVEKVKFTAWMIAVIMVARWAVILGSTLFRNKKGVADTLTESIVIREHFQFVPSKFKFYDVVKQCVPSLCEEHAT